MKDTIKQIIESNLPEEKIISNEEFNSIQEDYSGGLLEGEILGHNQCLSKINTSLIADEVLKVVGEKIKDDIQKYLLEKHIHFEKEDNLDFVEEKPYIDSLEFEKWLLQLLSNLSTNKENKK